MLVQASARRSSFGIQPRDGEDLVDAFQNRAGDPGPVTFETLGEIAEQLFGLVSVVQLPCLSYTRRTEACSDLGNRSIMLRPCVPDIAGLPRQSKVRRIALDRAFAPSMMKSRGTAGSSPRSTRLSMSAERSRHFPSHPRRGRAGACRLWRRHRSLRLGSDLRPCECHRFGSPANQGRRDPTPSTASCAPPTAPRSGGRRPISTDQPPRALERLLRATEPTEQLARRDVDQHLVHGPLAEPVLRSPPPARQSLLLASKLRSLGRSISTLPPWKPILPSFFPPCAAGYDSCMAWTTDRLRIVIHHLASASCRAGTTTRARRQFAGPRVSALVGSASMYKLVHACFPS